MIDFDNADLGIIALALIFIGGAIACAYRPDILKDVATFAGPIVAAIAGIARPRNGK